MSGKPRRLAIFVAFSGTGGVERVVFNLLQGLSHYDIAVDLVAVVGKKGWLPEMNWPNIRVIRLKATHTHLALFELAGYLRRERPEVLMAAKDRGVRIAVLARWLAGVNTRLVGQLHSTLAGLLDTQTPIQRWLRIAPMRWLFPKADLIICVSQGVAEETRRLTGLPADKFVALPNPVITPDIYAKSREPLAHPWFDDPAVPVIVSAGRLTKEKDFATLIRAFNRVRRQLDCRLLILGEGPLRSDLERLIARLGLQERVILPGYHENPFMFMKKASLFVLSSAWEGSGNVLIEAMALGIPVVSTDCPYGPGETLAGGKFGTLVPVGDDAALAQAMLDTLKHPLPAKVLQDAAADFTVERSAKRYLEVLGFAP